METTNWRVGLPATHMQQVEVSEMTEEFGQSMASGGGLQIEYWSHHNRLNKVIPECMSSNS